MERPKMKEILQQLILKYHTLSYSRKWPRDKIIKIAFYHGVDTYGVMFKVFCRSPAQALAC